jgi:hypothetical protein
MSTRGQKEREMISEKESIANGWLEERDKIGRGLFWGVSEEQKNPLTIEKLFRDSCRL